MNFYPLDGYADAAAAVNNMGGMRPPPAATNQQPVKVEQTAQLIREFDSVFEVVELTHLTPPQTPPQSPPRQPEPKQVSDEHTSNDSSGVILIFVFTSRRLASSFHRNHNNIRTSTLYQQTTNTI